MKILAIDTTTLFGSVALCDGMRTVAEEQLGVAVTHSERLVATIDHLLTLSSWEKKDIEGIAVAIGPGSFTGLRIGLATAKGIATGLSRPVAGVSSLLALACNGLFSDATVVSVIDARRAEVYYAAYKFTRGTHRTVLKEGLAAPADLCARLKKLKGRLLLTGDGVAAYESMLAAKLKGRAVIDAETLKFPRASFIARLALPRLKKGGDDIAKLAPNYLRHSDAEIGFKGGGKK